MNISCVLQCFHSYYLVSFYPYFKYIPYPCLVLETRGKEVIPFPRERSQNSPLFTADSYFHPLCFFFLYDSIFFHPMSGFSSVVAITYFLHPLRKPYFFSSYLKMTPLLLKYLLFTHPFFFTFLGHLF